MIYFISDVHLGYFSREIDKQKENQLIDFLTSIQHKSSKLFILGDLFDYWFDYKTVIPKYFFRTIVALENLKKTGTEIIYLVGNHDFGHFNFFKNEIGILPIEGDIEVTIDDKRFFLSHGDGKIKSDYSYNILKKILRNKFNQRLFRFLHPDCGIRLASNSSRTSRIYTDSKNFGEEDAMRQFAFQKIEEGFDFVIMGHRHVAENTSYNSGFYINLGEWLKSPYYGKFDSGKFQLIKL